MALRPTNSRLSAAVAAALFVVLVVVVYWAWHSGGHSAGGAGNADAAGPGPLTRRGSVQLTTSSPSRSHRSRNATFRFEKEAVGSIDFNEYRVVQVFTPYQGRIIAVFAAVGDDVKKGQPLFTVDSPDLLQAEFDVDRGGRRAGARPQKSATASSRADTLSASAWTWIGVPCSWAGEICHLMVRGFAGRVKPPGQISAGRAPLKVRYSSGTGPLLLCYLWFSDIG